MWQFKRDELNVVTNPDVTTDNSTSFKYKSSLLGESTADGASRKFKDVKAVVPLRYVCGFSRSFELPLINSKIHIALNWSKSCIMFNIAGVTVFNIKTTKLYVHYMFTLQTRGSVNLKKQVDQGFKRSIFWNEYKSKIETKTADNNNVTRFPLDASFQAVNRLFVLAFDSTALDNGIDGPNRVQRNSHRKHFLPRIDITNYNVLIDGRNFYDQPISDQIRKYDEIRKITTGKGDDYTTGYLLDYKYFKVHYRLTAVDLSN